MTRVPHLANFGTTLIVIGIIGFMLTDHLLVAKLGGFGFVLLVLAFVVDQSIERTNGSASYSLSETEE